MCELSLDETGLTRKRGAEILEHEFIREYAKLINHKLKIAFALVKICVLIQVGKGWRSSLYSSS